MADMTVTTFDREGNVVDERTEPVEDFGPTALGRLSALEEEVRGMKERAAAAQVTNPDARTVRDAVSGA